VGHLFDCSAAIAVYVDERKRVADLNESEQLTRARMVEKELNFVRYLVGFYLSVQLVEKELFLCRLPCVDQPKTKDERKWRERQEEELVDEIDLVVLALDTKGGQELKVQDGKGPEETFENTGVRDAAGTFMVGQGDDEAA